MPADQSADLTPQADSIRLFLCGDVMTGRGIDQLLPHSADPMLHEPYIGDARSYVERAESVKGAIPRPGDFDRPIARRVVRCSSSAIGTSLDATTLMSVAAVHSAMRDCQIASRQCPESGDGVGCRFSSGVEGGSLRVLHSRGHNLL